MSTPHAAPASPDVVPPARIPFLIDDAMVGKASKKPLDILLLSFMGGAFIALGFVFATTVQMGAGGAEWLGATKLAAGVVFSVGLILVVLTGADLFTSTTMTVMPLVRRRISPAAFAGHWALVYAGNLVGALAVAAAVMVGRVYMNGGGTWGAVAVQTTAGKLGHSWGEAFVLGILANFLVCLAVWTAMAGKSLADKVLAIVGPIALFVASGFEHSVANMFMLPTGMMIANLGGPEYWESAGATFGPAPAEAADFTLEALLWGNLVPVTLGNIVGGSVLVALFYWWVFMRDEQ